MAGLGTYEVHLQSLNGNLDGRKKEARILKSTRKELIALIGRKPNAGELALVEQIAWLQLRLSTMNQHLIEGNYTHFEANVYNAHVNSLARCLSRLGVVGKLDKAKPATASLADIMARHA
jgi:hypothetical protein